MKAIISLVIIFYSFSSHSYVVLIDPGHGGKELGAISYIIEKKNNKKYTKKIYEKDLSLKLAHKIKNKLSEYFTVYLTRSFDNTVTLQERAQMADTVKADLFISIHFNSSENSKSHGFETFYLDNHNDQAIHKVERIENKELEGEDKIINQILIDLAIKKTAKRSKAVASMIHKQLSKGIKRRFSIKDRGVKPSLFYVLALSKRPGVLLEAGFMSNPKEVFQIKADNYLNVYAERVTLGIKKYHETLPKKVPLF